MSKDEIAATLTRLGSATLGESGGMATDRRLKPAWTGARFAAPAYPVGCTPGDNLAVHVAVTTAPAGSVLVVDVGRVPDRGYWGEVLTTAAEAAGLAGLVIDGGVRDVAALEAHGFPVFSSTVALVGATKNQRGTAGATVKVGGVSVSAGDWVVGDVDGVTIVAAGVLHEVITAGEARESKETAFFASLREGRTTVELLALDASLITVE
ncbi:MAG TPA: RraA family protein [Acidimicrobiales bacterium]|nr:RraA family protein [Acidimicrobiales bacterium]